MGDWGWIGAARTGVSHERTGTRLQDAYSVRVGNGERPAIAVVISDGAGSAEFGGEGAALVCRTLSSRFSEHLTATGSLPEISILIDWVTDCRERIAAAAKNRDVELRAFAATLVCAVSDSEVSRFIHIGDGGIGVQLQEAETWICPTWPNQGEFASTTYFVTDPDSPHIRACEIEVPLRSLVAFTDGLERLALDFSRKEPHEPFFDAMVRPLLAVDTTGKDRDLSNHLQRFLGSDRVNSRTDDDKTLVAAVRRQLP